MQLLTFAIYTFLFILGSMGIFKFLLIATQEGQFLGKWQVALDWVYARNRYAAKLLGHCAICFAHLISILGFVVYVAMLWDIWVWNWWQSIIWYFIFVGISWLGMYKLIPKTQNNN